jgi:hypothetical protein
LIAALKRDTEPGSRSPNTARRITSSVTACMRGRNGNGVWSGHVATSRSATLAISSP